MSPDTKIANLQISGAKHMWKLLGPGMYNARPLFPITVRELLQNSHDAQRSAGITYPVAFTIARDASCNFTLTCDDAGIGMDAATIHDKFLVLGESGKEEGVGGFGVAKASILGACSSWELKTLDNLLTSEMLGLAPISKSEHRPGCSVALKYEVTEGDALKPTSWAIRDAMCYLVTSDVATKLVMNDNGKETVFNSPGTKVDEKRLVATVEEGRTSLKIYLVPQIKIDSYTSFGYGVSEHTIKGKIIYRLNGLTQFIGYSRNSSAEFNAIVDVTTESRPRELDYPFTVSREEMVYKFSNVIDEKLQPLFVNNLSTEIMMREKCGEKEVATTYYDGDLCASYGKISKTREKKERRGKEKAEREREQEEAANREREALNRELSGVMAEFVDSEERNELPDVKSVRRAIVPTSVQVVLDKVLERSPTGIKTCLKIAGKHKNSKPLTTRNIKLLQAWTGLIGMIMEANPKYQHPFGIGLVLDADYCALRYSEGSTVYYLFNATRYKVSDTMNTALAMLLDACHEVTHTQCQDHDERFTVSENTLRQNFINNHGMKALYALARYIRVGGSGKKEAQERFDGDVI